MSSINVLLKDQLSRFSATKGDVPPDAASASPDAAVEDAQSAVVVVASEGEFAFSGLDDGSSSGRVVPVDTGREYSIVSDIEIELQRCGIVR